MAVYDPRGGGNVHIDQVLTNISMGWQDPGPFVGERLAPAVPVRKQSDKYRVFGRETWVTEPGSDVRAPGTEANEIPGIEVSLEPYFAVEHALQIAVTDEERENADAPLSPDRDGTNLVTQKLLLAREVRIRDMVVDTSNYQASNTDTLSGTEQFDDPDSDPIAVFRTAQRAIFDDIFTEPNLAVVPYQVMSALEDHADFMERIKYVQVGLVDQNIVQMMLGIPNVIVPGFAYNTARMGQNEAIGYMWGKDVLLAYVPPRAGMKVPAFMYEFVWVYPGGQRQVVDRWREERRGSDIIRVRRRYDHRFIAKDAAGKSIAGYLIKSAIA